MYAPGEGVVDEALQLTHEHLVHIGLQLGHMGLQPGLLRLQSRYIGLQSGCIGLQPECMRLQPPGHLGLQLAHGHLGEQGGP